MDPGLATTTQATRQKHGVAITAVKTKNQKNARRSCGKSAARGIEVHARTSDQTHSAPPTAATAAGGVSRLKTQWRTYETPYSASPGASCHWWFRMGCGTSRTYARTL